MHINYKKAILKAKDRDTMVTGRSTGHPVRVIRNKLAREFDQMEKQGASPEELEAYGAGKLALAVQQGDVVNGSVMAGQSAGMVHKIEKAADIIRDIMQGAKAVFQEEKD